MGKMLEWGYLEMSSLVAEDRGSCIDFTFNNTLAPSMGYVAMPYEGSVSQVHMGAGSIPDIFSVVAAPGWEVVTDNFVSVAEGAKSVITVCQMLIG